MYPRHPSHGSVSVVSLAVVAAVLAGYYALDVRISLGSVAKPNGN